MTRVGDDQDSSGSNSESNTESQVSDDNESTTQDSAQMSDFGQSLSHSSDSPPDLQTVQDALVNWYQRDHRQFPWRETTEPYPVLVSEVMSQQTQLDRVVSAWRDFLEIWPSVEDLATSDQGDVVTFWSDHALGYNNRAKYLHEAATQVIEQYDGRFPRSPDELQELMGVGPYTANAVASFAFNDGDAVVDTNVERVLYRAFDVDDEDEEFRRVAETLMPAEKSRVWNNAIMELGGVACQSKPRCNEQGCPWREWCHAYKTGDFTAPDVPEQPAFEGSRRQFRGRVIQILGEYDELSFAELGPRVRVDYGGDHGVDWLRDLVEDLARDGLVEVDDSADGSSVSLQN